MELFDKSKETADKAECKEEDQQIIEEAGVQLTDDELEKVAGGVMPCLVLRNRPR